MSMVIHDTKCPGVIKQDKPQTQTPYKANASTKTNSQLTKATIHSRPIPDLSLSQCICHHPVSSLLMMTSMLPDNPTVCLQICLDQQRRNK